MISVRATKGGVQRLGALPWLAWPETLARDTAPLRVLHADAVACAWYGDGEWST